MHTSSPADAVADGEPPDTTDRGRLLTALERAARGEPATDAEEDAAIASGLLPGDYGDAHAIAAAALAASHPGGPR